MITLDLAELWLGKVFNSHVTSLTLKTVYTLYTPNTNKLENL